MTSHVEPQSTLEIYANVKRLGHSASSQVRLYGEDFDVVADPFLGIPGY